MLATLNGTLVVWALTYLPDTESCSSNHCKHPTFVCCLIQHRRSLTAQTGAQHVGVGSVV